MDSGTMRWRKLTVGPWVEEQWGREVEKMDTGVVR